MYLLPLSKPQRDWLIALEKHIANNPLNLGSNLKLRGENFDPIGNPPEFKDCLISIIISHASSKCILGCKMAKLITTA